MLNQISKLNSLLVPLAPSSSSTSTRLNCKTTDTDLTACLPTAAGQRRRGLPTCTTKPQKVNALFKKTVKCPAKRLRARTV